MTPLPAELETWRDSGTRTVAYGVELWHRVEGRGPWLVCFHGFPTSSWDWHRLLPGLVKHRRVLVFDFPGYGLSQKTPGRSFSLLRQLDTALELLSKLGIDSFDLLAHDMGNSVACELLYRRETGEDLPKLRSLVLLNGGVYMDLHQPLLTQRLLRTPVLGHLVARLSSYRVFRAQYAQVYADPTQFDEAHYRTQWALMQYGGGRRTLAGIAGYMRERVIYGERWTGPLERFELPFTLIWGQQDSIAVEDIALRLSKRNPRARLVLLPGIGHYPQLETPQAVSAKIIRHLDAVG